VATPDAQAPSSATELRYFPALDGLRFICCSIVVINHACLDPVLLADARHPWLVAFVRNLGTTGVDIFFALSGFLITKLLLDERALLGRVSLFAFYMRRTLRIWPVYYAAVALGFGAAAIFGARYLRPFGATLTPQLFTTGLWSHLLFVPNWFTVDLPSALHVLWSVGVEEQFYLAFPVTFIFARRKHPVFLCVTLGLLLAWASRIYMATHEIDMRHITIARADNLLLGALLAQVLHAWPKQISAFFRRGGLALELFALAAVGAFDLWTVEATVKGPLGWVAFYISSALVTSFLVGTIGLGRGPIARALARPPMRYLGQLTYAGYVFHMYAVAIAWTLVARLHAGTWASALVRSALAIPLTMLIAWICRITFEARILKLKDRFQPVAPVQAEARHAA
jgi:peptidoglycan/LPS O-acetylase OafA/YrhL